MSSPGRIVMGADHRGVEVLTSLRAHLESLGWAVSTVPVPEGEAVDYPDVAWTVAEAVASSDAAKGILVCGSGIGMSISANKVARVRAALVHDAVAGAACRRHNDANVLCLAADAQETGAMIEIVDAWLDAEFEGGRHKRRVEKIELIEQGLDPGKG